MINLTKVTKEERAERETAALAILAIITDGSVIDEFHKDYDPLLDGGLDTYGAGRCLSLYERRAG